jgi:light-regulated signal transduction histidine kinase (bacteriophytochrome)
VHRSLVRSDNFPQGGTYEHPRSKVHRQQPAGEASRHFVMLIACDRLTDDCKQGLCVAQQQALDSPATLSDLSLRTLPNRFPRTSHPRRTVALQLQEGDRRRRVQFVIEENVAAEADAPLMRIVFENLLGNAWKFSSKKKRQRIEFGTARTERGVEYFVRDNGAGFEPAHATRLFQPFQRLHTEAEFPGLGIALATVKRIITRHGGEIWAEGAIGEGATIRWTLPPAAGDRGTATFAYVGAPSLARTPPH